MPPKKKIDDEDLTAYYFKWDGKELCVQDLPLEVFEEIELATGVGYPALIANPFRTTAQAQRMLVEKCAATLGITMPAITPRLVLEVFDLGPDVVPDLYRDGVAVPKASEPATATIS